MAEIVGEKANEIDSLAVEGPLNEADFNTLWEMGYKGWLEYLDLSKASPEGDRIPDNAFFHEYEQTEKSHIFGDRLIPLAYLNTVILPQNLKEIGEYAFACTRIKSIMFPESLQNIGAWSFYRCPALEGKITFPGNIPELKEYSFAECPKIEEVEIPSSVRCIWGFCFDRCHSLKKVDFPKVLITSLSTHSGKRGLKRLFYPRHSAPCTTGRSPTLQH